MNVYFISLGCPKNLVDSEHMMGQLLAKGYQVVEDPKRAEVIIVNTCGFIQAAKEESIEKILEAAELKTTGNLKHLVVAGCLTQRYKEKLIESLPEVDLFVGTGEFQNIGEILDQACSKVSKRNFFDQPTYLDLGGGPRVNSQPFYRAYLKISEGCHKQCAFCAIPKIRGPLQSRPIESIVNEAQLLVAGGVRELMIVSHDFTDYGLDLRRGNPQSKERPEELLRALAEISGLDWVRLLYLYPDGVTQEMVRAISESPKLVNYFDLPLQHINDSVLRAMNRKTSRKLLERVLDMIRQEIPEAVIRTHFLIGFPGETEDQFQELLRFVQDQRFDRLGSFAFSPEEGTAAYQRADQVDDQTKQRRLEELMAVQREISREKNRAFVGRTVQVLVEGESEETELLLQGRMATQAPDIDGLVLINKGTAQVGELVSVEISEALDYDLVGAIIGDAQH